MLHLRITRFLDVYTWNIVNSIKTYSIRSLDQTAYMTIQSTSQQPEVFDYNKLNHVSTGNCEQLQLEEKFIDECEESVIIYELIN